MSKRFYHNLGLTLLALSVLLAVVIPLVTGGVVSTTPLATVGQSSATNGSYIAFVIHVTFPRGVMFLLLVSFVVGLSCLVISSRKMR